MTREAVSFEKPFHYTKFQLLKEKKTVQLKFNVKITVKLMLKNYYFMKYSERKNFTVYPSQIRLR